MFWGALAALIVLGGLAAAGVRARRAQRTLHARSMPRRLPPPAAWHEVDEAPEPVRNPSAQAWLTNVGHAFQLTMTRTHLEGEARGWSVKIWPRPGEGYRGLVLRLDGEGRIPRDVTIQTRNEAPEDLLVASQQGIDDARFDLRFAVAGEAPTLLAMLGRNPRAGLLALTEQSRFRLHGGVIELVSADTVRRPPAIRRWVKETLRIAEQLSLRPKEVTTRLEGHVRSRDLASVRLANLEAIQATEGEARAQALMQEGLTDHDPAFRLQLSALLERTEVAKDVLLTRRAPAVVRARALAQVLQATARREHRDLLDRVLQGPGEGEARAAFARVLGEWGGRAGRKALLEHLTQVRQPKLAAAFGAALEALGGGEDAERALRTAMLGDRKALRILAPAMGEVGDADTITWLLERSAAARGKTKTALAHAVERIEVRERRDSMADDARRKVAVGQLSLLEENDGGLSLAHRNDPGKLGFPHADPGELAVVDE